MEPLMQQLCDWLGKLDENALPEPLIHEVKRRVLDSIAVAVAGRDAEPCRMAREQACVAWAPAEGATVWGTCHQTLPAMAAFANGVATRYLDYNDTYLSLEPAHPSDNIAAVLAAAEVAGASGADALLATVLAY